MSDIEQDDAAFRELELALLYSRPLPAWAYEPAVRRAVLCRLTGRTLPYRCGDCSGRVGCGEQNCP
jgi:hypothetical protein